MQITSLRTKFLIRTIVAITLMGLALVFFVETVLYQKLLTKLQKRGISISNHVASLSINPILAKKYFELELMTKDFMSSEEDIVYIFITNPQGKVLAHTFENGFPVDLKKIAETKPEQSLRIQHFKTEKEGILDIAHPLVNGRAGFAHVGFSEGPLKKDINEINWLLLKLIIIALIVGSTISIALASTIIQPVSKLAEAAEAIGRGDLESRININTKDEIGQLGKAFNAMIDRRKEVEEELRLSEKKFRDITSSLGEGILVMNKDGHLVFMNPEAERMLGWTGSELLGKDVHNIVHYQKADGTPYPATDCPHFKVVSTGTKFTGDDEVFTRRDGTIFPVAYISAPIFENGKATASVIAFMDITTRKQAEKDREKLITELREALEKIHTLRGLIPICSSCKKIRDDKGYWNQIEVYISEHSDAEFSHGLCPVCAKKLYPDYYKE